MKMLFRYALLLFSLYACSENGSANNPADHSNAVEASTKHIASVKVVFLKTTNLIDKIEKSYIELEAYINKALLSAPLNCNEGTQSFECQSKLDLEGVDPGIYRVVVKSGNGLLGSETVEITKDYTPLYITIDDESTGDYLLSLITNQTGYREDEIDRRLAHVLALDINQNNDYQTLLYSLFVYYGGKDDVATALNNIITRLKADKPVKLPGLVLSQSLKSGM